MHFDPNVVEAIQIALIGLLIWAVKHGITRFLRHSDDIASRLDLKLDARGREWREAIEGQNVVLERLEESHAEHRRSLTEIRTVLVGIDGRNGLNGTVKDLAERLREVESHRRASL